MERSMRADHKAKANELIMVTNSPNPFNDDDSKGAFYGPSKRWYKDLSESARELVDDYLIAKKKILL